MHTFLQVVIRQYLQVYNRHLGEKVSREIGSGDRQGSQQYIHKTNLLSLLDVPEADDDAVKQIVRDFHSSLFLHSLGPSPLCAHTRGAVHPPTQATVEEDSSQ